MTTPNIKRQITEVKVPEHPLPEWARDILNEVKAMTTPEDIDHAEILFAIAMTLASQHTTGLINKEKAIESIKEHAQSLITLHTQKVTVSPAGNMVLTVASNMIKRGEEVPPNMTAVLVIELERIKQLTNPTEAGEK